MTALLTDNLPLLAGAPNGIKKLRELILELAVRGKLVPQDPSDEPASELLKRIAEERACLVAEGKIKKQKPLAAISEEEKPFALPIQWEWTRLGSIASLENGDRSSNYPNKSQLVDSGIPFINAGHLQNGLVDLQSMNFITRDCYDRLRAGKVQDEDILFCLRGSLGKSAIVRGISEGAIASSLVIVRMTHSFSNEYLMGYFSSPLAFEMVKRFDNGTAQPNLSAADLNRFLVPLPPLAEQHRIVAKVDELMALCDRLEAQQADAESAHAQLVQALLDSLTQASDATDFAANWQRLAEHFHTLFTTEPSIDALKQTLLQLAVMGKLVPQDPTDEPASKLIKRIQAEKQRLVAEGKIKKQKPQPEIAEQEKPFALPEGWRWARLGEIGISATGKTPSTNNTKFFGGDLQFIGPGQISVHGEIAEAEKWLTELARDDTSVAEPGDLLMVCIGGSIGKCAIADREMAFNQQINSTRILIADHRYLFKVLASPTFKASVWASATGTATPIINRSKWDELLVSIPPHREQQRIVAKADQLMALCDTLKQQINAATEMQSVLLNAMMAQV